MFVILAQTSQLTPPAPSLFVIFLPWLFLGIALGIILAVMAQRKGKNAFLWFILGMIPLVGFYAAFVLASRPDIALLERLFRLEDKLTKLTLAPKPPEIPKTSI